MKPADLLAPKFLNSSFDHVAMRNQLLAIAKQKPDGIVRVDFSSCEPGSSVGIARWLKAAHNVKVCYQKAPVWLLEQFNIQRDLLNGFTLESILVPMRKKNSESVKEMVLQFDRDLPLQSSYKDFEILQGNELFVSHFDPEATLAFMSEYWARCLPEAG